MQLISKVILISLLLVGCTAQGIQSVQNDTPEDRGVVLVGAGDIARCSFSAAKLTAQLLDSIEGTMFTAGDNVYQNGTAKEFRECYEPSWGRHKARTRPSPGNHDYGSKDAAPYFEYFGENAGPAGLGYYSYNLGAWHILSLNSNVPAGESSLQMKWLREDLSKNKHKCMLAYWHHPVFVSGMRGAQPTMRDIFAELYKQGVDVVVTGHEHVYERYEPMNAVGESDHAHGIRSYIVGTGGAIQGVFGKAHPRSKIRITSYGVIKFTLKKESYDWQFIPVLNDAAVDSGTGTCH